VAGDNWVFVIAFQDPSTLCGFVIASHPLVLSESGILSFAFPIKLAESMSFKRNDD
jgi:hypothetical protein